MTHRPMPPVSMSPGLAKALGAVRVGGPADAATDDNVREATRRRSITIISFPFHDLWIWPLAPEVRA